MVSGLLIFRSTFQANQADKVDEQNRIIMTPLERQRPERQEVVAYTESLVASDIGMYAESVIMRQMRARACMEEHSSDGGYFSISNGSSSGAHIPKWRLYGAGMLKGSAENNLHEIRRIRLMEELRQEAEREMRSVFHRARVLEKQRQIEGQERQKAENEKSDAREIGCPRKVDEGCCFCSASSANSYGEPTRTADFKSGVFVCQCLNMNDIFRFTILLVESFRSLGR